VEPRRALDLVVERGRGSGARSRGRASSLDVSLSIWERVDISFVRDVEFRLPRAGEVA
jgi:hypothetical protein